MIYIYDIYIYHIYIYIYIYMIFIYIYDIYIYGLYGVFGIWKLLEFSILLIEIYGVILGYGFYLIGI
jgi:hypothetical protein